MITIVLKILFLLIMAVVSAGLYLLNDKIGNVYEMQLKFNNMERDYANKVEKINREYTEEITKLKNELEVKDEFITNLNSNYTKLYEGTEKLAKTIKDKIK